MSARSTAFKTTKINVKHSGNFPEDSLKDLEEKFMTYEAAKTDSVLATREAAIATAKAAMATQRSTIAMTELLKIAAHYDPRIASETTWISYKNSDGEIIFEGITERIQRNAIRAQIQQMGNNTEDFPSDRDMYEQEEEASE